PLKPRHADFMNRSAKPGCVCSSPRHVAQRCLIVSVNEQQPPRIVCSGRHLPSVTTRGSPFAINRVDLDWPCMPEDVSAHLFKNFVVLLVMAAIGVDPARVPAWTSSARQQEFTAGSTTQKEDVPVLWRDPGEIEKLDFADGPGGARTRPEPPFQFIDESLTGTKAKVRVVDSHGV